MLQLPCQSLRSARWGVRPVLRHPSVGGPSFPVPEPQMPALPLRLALSLLLVAAFAAPARAQDATARFGAWQLRSEAPPPTSNVMTYEPWGDGGMRVTVSSTGSDGDRSEWSYVTAFDGVFRPVEGQRDAETAVEPVDARTTRITNRRAGRVSQVILNTLSEDGNTIHNEYVRFDAEGRIVGVAHAVYDRIR